MDFELVFPLFVVVCLCSFQHLFGVLCVSVVILCLIEVTLCLLGIYLSFLGHFVSYYSCCVSELFLGIPLQPFCVYFMSFGSLMFTFVSFLAILSLLPDILCLFVVPWHLFVSFFCLFQVIQFLFVVALCVFEIPFACFVVILCMFKGQFVSN